MPHKSVILTFPRDLVDKPMVSRAIRDHDVEVNILQAFITPDEDGHIFAIFAGEGRRISRALGFLRGQGVRVTVPVQNLVRDESRCVSCGACVGQCPSDAFAVDARTAEIRFHADRCIACELCIPACSFGALAAVGEHLRGGRGGR